MDNFILPLLMGAPANSEAGTGSIFTSFLPLIAIVFIFYFLIIRPQNKKRKETEKMLAALKKGDRVVTIGGLHGTVQSVKDSTVIIKVDDNVKLEFLRSAVSNVITAAREKEEKIEDKSGEKEKSEGQDEDKSSNSGE
jgi:preprotein translocase subunit YajC